MSYNGIEVLCDNKERRNWIHVVCFNSCGNHCSKESIGHILVRAFGGGVYFHEKHIIAKIVTFVVIRLSVALLIP